MLSIELKHVNVISLSQSTGRRLKIGITRSSLLRTRTRGKSANVVNLVPPDMHVYLLPGEKVMRLDGSEKVEVSRDLIFN